MEETKIQIEQMITEYLQEYAGEETEYIDALGKSFSRDDLWAFIYDHLAEIGGWDQGSILYHLNSDIEGILFGRVMESLRNVYNDQSGGESFYEQDQMGSAIYHLRALVTCDFASWSRDLLQSEVERKEKLGHFNQTPKEYEVFKEILKKFLG